MADLDLRMRSPGVEQVTNAFDKLTKAEQKLVLAGSAIGRETSKATRAGISGFERMATSVGKTLLAMGGVATGTALISKTISALREDYRKLQEMQDKSKESQRTWSEEVGEFVSNNPLYATKDPAGAQKWISLSAQWGQRLGERGPQEALAAVTSIRSNAAGASEELQQKAFERAILQKMISPAKTDIAAYAVGIIKAVQAAEAGGESMSAEQAHNLLAIMGSQAGGSVGTQVQNLGQLRAAGLAGETDIADTLALHAFFTSQFSDTEGAPSSTLITNLIGKAARSPLKLGGKEVQKAEGSGLDVVVDLLDRINAGEFGTSPEEIKARKDELRKQLAKGSQGIAGLTVIEKFGADLKGLRDMFKGATTGTEDYAMSQHMLKEKLVGYGLGSEERLRQQKGQLELIQQAGREGEWSRTRERLELFREAAGVRWLQDPGQTMREWANRGDRPEDYENDQKMRLIRRMIESRTAIGAQAGMADLGVLAEQDPEQIKRLLESESPTERLAGQIQGAQSVPELIRLALQAGAVSPENGLDRFETFLLMQGGATVDQLRDVSGKDLRGDKDFAQALQKLVDTILATFGQNGDAERGIRDAVKSSGSAGNQAGKDIDSI